MAMNISFTNFCSVEYKAVEATKNGSILHRACWSKKVEMLTLWVVCSFLHKWCMEAYEFYYQNAIHKQSVFIIVWLHHWPRKTLSSVVPWQDFPINFLFMSPKHQKPVQTISLCIFRRKPFFASVFEFIISDHHVFFFVKPIFQ